jgi:large subunit ribosomal protein L9
LLPPIQQPHPGAAADAQPGPRRPQVILVKEVEGVGKEGDLLQVPVGYWRNYLAPQRMAKIASEGILA